MENNKKDLYVVCLKSGSEQQYGSLELMASKVNPIAVEAYMRLEYHDTYEGPVNITDWYHHHIIDAQGEPAVYAIGDYEVVDIGPDNGCTNFFGRAVTVRNRITDEYCTFTSKTKNRFLFSDIKPALIALKDTDGSAAQMARVLDAMPSYLDLQEECEMLRSRNKRLENKFNVLKDILNE